MTVTDNTELALKSAVQLHQQGNLQAAAAAYRQVLDQEPEQLQALQGLAGLHLQQGDPAGAQTVFEQALKANPSNPDLLEALGQVLMVDNNVAGAVNAFRACLEVDQGRAGVWYNLGVALQQLNKLDDAQNAYERVIELAPNIPQALNNLANLKYQQQDFEASVALYRRAMKSNADQSTFQKNLLMSLRALADQQLDGHQYADARSHYLELLQHQPGDFACQYNLGLCYRGLGRPDLAEEQFRAAVEQQPERTDARQNLGLALRRMGRPSDALDHFEAALAQKPEDPHLWASLAGAEKELGENGQAIIHYQKALALDPLDLDVRSNLLMTMNYLDDIAAADLFAAHRDYGQQVLERPAPAHASNQSKDGPIRIGFVSADLRRHSVAYFLEPLLENLDQERFNVVAYFNHHQHDETSDRLKAHCSQWRVIFGESDETVARQITEDRIDVLIDLSGHSGGNRLPVFARKPAPVQATWLGYPNTTGLAAMDYRITDGYTDPPGQDEQNYSEKLIRLGGHFSCYSAPPEAPAVAAPPYVQTGHITFGSFNNLAKVTPQVISTWGALLRAVPASKLLLKTRVLADPAVCKRLIDALAKEGAAADRIQLVARDNQKTSHLTRYNDIDIALDPFPYNGTTTTCEALWCGVPVIAIRGNSHRARVSASILQGIQLSDLVAGSVREYVEIGRALALDGERLAQLRMGMRDRILTSPLMDGAAFAREFASAVTSMVPRTAD